MLVSLIALSAIAQDYKVEIVSLKNTDARFVFEEAKGLLEGVHCVIDPEKNTISITGLKDSVSEAIRMIQLFDVKSIPVDLSIVVESVRFKWVQSARVWTPNNGKWSFHHEGTDTQFTISPRVREDGSVLISLTTYDDQKKPAGTVFRLPLDQTATFLIGGKPSWVTVAPKDKSGKRDWRTEVKVTYRGLGTR